MGFLDVAGWAGSVVSIVGMFMIVRKASAVKSSMDEATALQQKDINTLQSNNKMLWEKVNSHDEKLSEFDKQLTKISTNMENIMRTLQRIEKFLDKD